MYLLVQATPIKVAILFTFIISLTAIAILLVIRNQRQKERYKQERDRNIQNMLQQQRDKEQRLEQQVLEQIQNKLQQQKNLETQLELQAKQRLLEIMNKKALEEQEQEKILLKEQEQRKQRLEQARQEKKDALLKQFNDTQLVDRIMDKTLVLGDTTSIVEAMFGKPNDIEKKVSKTKIKEIWKYQKYGDRSNSYSLKITIENNKVTGWEDK